MDLQQLVVRLASHEFSLLLMILKIFKARVSHDYLADNNLEVWVCEHHDHPYLFSYPLDANSMSGWYPTNTYSHYVCSCNDHWQGNWCEIYFKCKIKELNKEDCNCNLLDYFYCFYTEKFVKPPWEVKVICS